MNLYEPMITKLRDDANVHASVGDRYWSGRASALNEVMGMLTEEHEPGEREPIVTAGQLRSASLMVRDLNSAHLWARAAADEIDRLAAVHADEFESCRESSYRDGWDAAIEWVEAGSPERPEP